ncbi:hypothetical protein PR048_004277 [Dryococelus australis]|uniref:Uncharacterized protein n=1 Tax=Dryococelus australis TaxID=614101 RepID=A0ABQ9I5H1_9NEOP|nr:hypothetical protein PR048_004277 [Dryococelus australis]
MRACPFLDWLCDCLGTCLVYDWLPRSAKCTLLARLLARKESYQALIGERRSDILLASDGHFGGGCGWSSRWEVLAGIRQWCVGAAEESCGQVVIGGFLVDRRRDRRTASTSAGGSPAILQQTATGLAASCFRVPPHTEDEVDRLFVSSSHVPNIDLPQRNTTVEGATVAERLALSPPTKANRALSPAGSLDFRKWESCRTMPLVGGFPRGSPVFPTPSFRRCSVFTSITLIGSQDLAVTSRPNLSTNDCRSHMVTSDGRTRLLSKATDDARKTMLRNVLLAPEKVVRQRRSAISCFWYCQIFQLCLLGTPEETTRLQQRRTGFKAPVGVYPDFSSRKSCQTTPLVGEFFTEFSRFPRPCIPELLHSYVISPSFALKTSLLTAAQISQLSDLCFRFFGIPFLYLWCCFSPNRDRVRSAHRLQQGNPSSMKLVVSCTILPGKTARGNKDAAPPRRLDCSPATKANQVQSPSGSLPDFRKWDSFQTISVVSGFPRGSPISPALAFKRCFRLTSFHPSSVAHQLTALREIDWHKCWLSRRSGEPVPTYSIALPPRPFGHTVRTAHASVRERVWAEGYTRSLPAHARTHALLIARDHQSAPPALMIVSTRPQLDAERQLAKRGSRPWGRSNALGRAPDSGAAVVQWLENPLVESTRSVGRELYIVAAVAQWVENPIVGPQ